MIEELLRESSAAEYFRREGREEGQREGARAMALEALEGRFGALPEDAVAAVQRADEATLRAIMRHLATESWAQVRERLGLR